jgi:hypothetical protein
MKHVNDVESICERKFAVNVRNVRYHTLPRPFHAGFANFFDEVRGNQILIRLTLRIRICRFTCNGSSHGATRMSDEPLEYIWEQRSQWLDRLRAAYVERNQDLEEEESWEDEDLALWDEFEERLRDAITTHREDDEDVR